MESSTQRPRSTSKSRHQEEEKTNSNFKVKDIEGVNNDLIQNQLQSILEQKSSKFKKELESYRQKLEILESTSKLPIKDTHPQKKLYLKQIQKYEEKLNKVEQDYEQLKAAQKDGNEGELMNAFFSHQQNDHQQVERKPQKQQMVITLENGQRFFISELFYSLLFSHQVEALHWLLQQHSENKGSILADEMGLGKTISTIALIVALYTTHIENLESGVQTRNQCGPFLIVCPATVIKQWEQELKLWTASFPMELHIYNFQTYESNMSKLSVIKEAFKNSGIVITSYEFLRSEASIFKRRTWDYIILDEAQKIKNSQSQIHQACTSLSSNNRLILSGTPMQNNLTELWSLFNFIQTNLLGDLEYFENTFCKQIVKGGYQNATPVQQETAKECILELRNIIKRHILRRTKKQLKMECQLPERNEFMVFCNLTQAQLNLYERYLKNCQDIISTDYNRPEVLGVLTNLRKICSHPFLFFQYFQKPKHKNSFKMIQTMNFEHMPEYTLYKQAKDDELRQKLDLQNVESKIASRYYQLSGKMRVLMNFLEEWNRKKDKNGNDNKILIFSQTKKVLDIIQWLLEEREYNYLRMDGDVTLKERSKLIDKFNNEQEKVFVFLLTTRVGGLGINLTSANKVVIFDPDWNPMIDVQATDRALRIGQKRDVMIYRFIVDDTIEEKIYHRQAFKKYMADKILQDPSMQKLFEKSAMHELFEMPKNIINSQKEQRLLSRYRDPEKSVSELEEEVKKEISLEDGEIQQMQRYNSLQKKEHKMYALTKKNTEKDQKLQEFFKNTTKDLKKLEPSVKRMKKDIEQDLITKIFKDEEEEMKNNDLELSRKEFNVRLEARKQACNLLSKIGGYQDSLQKQDTQMLSSNNLLQGLLNKQQSIRSNGNNQVMQNIPKQSSVDVNNLEIQIRKLYKDCNEFELDTDFIIDRFKDLVEQDQTLKLKQALKRVAFFDKSSKMWILRD